MEVPAGESGALACATCHWTHGPEGAVDSLRRRGWEFPCASCHGDDALPLYRYFHQPERRAGIIEKTLWTDRPEDAIPVQSQPAQPNPPIPSGPNQESR
jgi:hypothetical protein